MKILDKAELRKRCQEGDLNDVIRLSDRYAIEDGKLRFLRNNITIYEISVEDVTIEIANKVDHSLLRPIRDTYKGLLKFNKRLTGQHSRQGRG